jgi:hypothetical protein
MKKMNHDTPFYIRGIKVSVHNKNLVRFYHVDEDIDDNTRQLFDNITQYLMDEQFITVKKCRVEIICA